MNEIVTGKQSQHDRTIIITVVLYAFENLRNSVFLESAYSTGLDADLLDTQ